MINVTIGESKTQSEKPFPKLMKSSKYGSIIFATSSGEVHITGTMLVVGTPSDILGEHSRIWLKENFTDFNEPITLQNA